MIFDWFKRLRAPRATTPPSVGRPPEVFNPHLLRAAINALTSDPHSARTVASLRRAGVVLSEEYADGSTLDHMFESATSLQPLIVRTEAFERISRFCNEDTFKDTLSENGRWQIALLMTAFVTTAFYASYIYSQEGESTAQEE